MSGRIRRQKKKEAFARLGLARKPALTPEERHASKGWALVQKFGGVLDKYINPFPAKGPAQGLRIISAPKKTAETFVEAMESREAQLHEKVAVFYKRLMSKQEEQMKMAFALHQGKFSKTDSVASLGCGYGLHETFLAKNIVPEGRVVGVDISGRMVSRAKRIAQLEGAKNVKFIQGKASNTGLNAGSFDKVVCNWFLDMPAADRMATISEMRRIIRKGKNSRAIITLPVFVYEPRLNEIMGCLKRSGFRAAYIRPKGGMVSAIIAGFG